MCVFCRGYYQVSSDRRWILSYLIRPPMQSIHDSGNRGHRMLVSSPKGIWNCQSLSIHLPPLRDPRDPPARTKYLSPPMSASPKRSKFAEAGQSHLLYHQRYNPSPSAHSTTSKQSPPLNKSVKSKHQEQRRNLQTPPGNAEVEPSRASLQLGSDVRPVREGSIDDLSSNVHDSPEAHQLTSGAPGVARRAKAHVPSACVNCKRKHLACETKRPCNRCLQNGKEVSEFQGMANYWLIRNRQLA